MRSHLNKLYGDAQYNDVIRDLDEEQIRELAKNLSKGIPFATPVFDGAKEPDIVDALVAAVGEFLRREA